MQQFRLPLQTWERRRLLLATDLLLASCAVLLALWLWALRDPLRSFGAAFVRQQARWFLLLVGLWLVLAYVNDLYESRVAHSLGASATALSRVSLVLAVVYSLVFFLAPRQALPRLFVLYYAALSMVLVGVWRAAYVLLGRRAFRLPTLILGAGWAGRTIAETIRDRAGPEYELIGFIDDDLAKQDQQIAGLPVIGPTDHLRAAVKVNNVLQVILAITHQIPAELLAALLDCLELGVAVIPMPVVYEQITGQVPVEHVGDNWYVALPVQHPGTHGLYPFAKRLMDIVLSSLGLVFLGLALPFIALAIYMESPGPIFYSQQRVGKGGRCFRMFKFRSMVPDAETSEAVWAQQGDPRITTVGKLLRKTHLDEFPQFLNILRGEMSAVGPRPERPEFVEELEAQIPFYRLRHAVRPGMAGWGLVQQGYVASTEDALARLRYDLYYIKHQSLLLDLLILMRTVVDTLTLGGR
ncbi:MAG: hypothetical protein AMJ93_14570 [Anaerolineae bacterium SM23_84]|nr:MAG: hypothetical protein AMJ93_14570 [Anaerolineae bacterium SM23_84]